MNIIKEYLFVIIISFEFLFIVLGICVSLVWEKPMLMIYAHLNATEDVLKYITFVPVCLGIWSVTQSRKLLFPDHEKKQILHQWPDYWKLRVRFNVTFLYACLFAISGISCWVFLVSTLPAIYFSVMFFSILGAISVAISIYWARVNLDEILIKIKH